MGGWPAPRGNGKGIQFLREHVNDLDGPCLIWPMFRDPDSGYGQLGYMGQKLYAHRKMCEMANGPPPSDIHEACHSCGQGHQGCIHPKHLSWKTPSGNHLDRRRHGTATTSIWGPKGKLTEVDRGEIIKLKDYLTQREIGKLFGVPFQTVSRIHLAKPKTPKHHVFRDTDDRRLIEARRRGIKSRQVAAEMGLTQGSILARYRRLRMKGQIPQEGVPCR